MIHSTSREIIRQLSRSCRALIFKGTGMEEYQEWQMRLFEEYSELMTRQTKLEAYTNTSAFQDLEFQDRQLLSAQLHTMKQYSYILSLRIARFTKNLESNK
jgi:hypothetical protein